MNIKKITEKLSQIRDSVTDNGMLSDADRMELESLVRETIDNAPEHLQKLPTNIQDYLPIPDNDNKCLTAEQKFRLRLMEKTGTGSASIH